MTLINDVIQIQAECTKCTKVLVAMNGDIIHITPTKMINTWWLVVLCDACYKELEKEERSQHEQEETLSTT